MAYNWKKIFKTKTNKELYDIVVGRKVLSNEAVEYAKAELDNRNFEYDDMEANNAVWEISRLVDEENLARLEISGSRAKPISIKVLLLIILAICIFYFVAPKYLGFDFPLGIFLFLVIFSTLYVVLNNFQAKKQKQTQIQRLERIKELKEKLEQENLLGGESPLFEEIKRYRIEEGERMKNLLLIVFVLVGIYMILFIIGAFAN